MKRRLGIFLFYDSDGIADRYIEYLLKSIRPLLTWLIVIANGAADAKAISMFQNLADDFWPVRIKALTFADGSTH